MLETITNPDNIILTVAMIGAFLTIFMLGAPLLVNDQGASRLKQVAKRREELQAAAVAQHDRPQASQIRLNQGKSLIRIMTEKLRLVNPAQGDKMRMFMARAGLRGQAPIYTYAFFRFIGPIILGILAAVYLFVLAKTNLSYLNRGLLVVAAMLIGFFMPYILVKNMISKRQQAITRQFPDALDLMVICVEAGLSMEGAFARVSDEIQEESLELAEEIGLTSAELSFLPSRTDALEGFYFRTGLQSVRSLTTALIQTERYGTPIATALRVLSQEQREARMSRAEKKAGALPAQLTVPMIVFFLPVLFVVIMGPAGISIIRTLANK
jgi:tight adherence protein C